MSGRAEAVARGTSILRWLPPSIWLIGLAIAACIVLRLIPFQLPVAHGLATRFVNAKAAAELVQDDPAAARLGPREFASAVAAWRARHADTLAPLERQTEERFRDALTFEGEDGTRHVYLGGEDGYYWLKLTNTMLAHGTVCDRVERGTCIDALGNAPLGQTIEYTDSPHVYLMAALQRLLTWLRPGFPLSTTAILLPLLLSVLAVVPAFLIAERVSGRLGGLTAALLLSCNGLVFVRGSYSDDDIWIVVMPVFAMGFITAAFGRTTWRGNLLFAGFGGIMLAVLAVAWKGWPLFVLYTAAGLIALGAWAALAALISKRRGRPADLGFLWAVCLCTLSITAGFVAAGWLLGVRVDLGVFTGGLASVIGRAGAPPANINTAPLSDVFHMVQELISVDAEMLQRATRPVATGLGLVGFSLALLALSTRRQSILALALLVLGPVIAALLSHYGSARTPMLLVPALTGLAAGVGAWFRDRAASHRETATGILGLAWLGATLWMSFEGERYILLSMAPLSVAAGIAVGRVGSAVSALGLGERPRLVRTVRALAAGALAVLALGPVASLGLTQARAFAPSINGAWTGAFSTIRAQSSSDAIIDIWWDYGHWAKYYTDRAVVLDGASLLNQSVHWMARALAAPSDTETLGWLRMMNCGAVADPDGERPARPYTMLNRWSADPGLAFRSMIELSRRPRGQAADFLRAAGLPEPRLRALLATAYCTPPPSYLVLTTGLFSRPGWLVSGLWDAGRAHIVELARHGSIDAALPVMQAKYGLSEAAARDIYAAARGVQNENDRIAFAAPGAQVWSRDWQSCVAQDDGLHCALNLGSPTAGYVRDATVDPEHPDRTRIRIVPSADAAAIEAIPALVEIARADGLQEVALANATAGLALLVDPDRKRVFAGTPDVLHSTLVRLALLDGRYSSPFQKIYDQSAIDGEHITVWKIGWEEP